MPTRSINRINHCSTTLKQPDPLEDRGFAAVTAVLLVSFGVLAMSLTAFGASAMYADSVSARETRIQNQLNSQACQDSHSLIQAKDAFVSGTINVPEFGCILSF
jgi:hypothetical protein